MEIKKTKKIKLKPRDFIENGDTYINGTRYVVFKIPAYLSQNEALSIVRENWSKFGGRKGESKLVFTDLEDADTHHKRKRRIKEDNRSRGRKQKTRRTLNSHNRHKEIKEMAKKLKGKFSKLNKREIALKIREKLVEDFDQDNIAGKNPTEPYAVGTIIKILSS